MLYNQKPGYNLLPLKGANPTPPTLMARILATINSVLTGKGVISGLSGSYSNTVVAVATFTVTISAQANINYKVVATPSNLLSASDFYINNKTLTSFDLVYLVVKTGTVAFDWVLVK